MERDVFDPRLFVLGVGGWERRGREGGGVS